MWKYKFMFQGGFVVSRIDEVRALMMQAMKDKNKPRKDALSALLTAFKQQKETLELTPADRTDIIEECNTRIAVYSEFAPKMMDEAEIEAEIKNCIAELGLESATMKEKGKIMKVLMPKVKGKADGSLVNQVLSKILQ